MITTDAMGCRKAVAKQIIAKKGEYVLALKGNQSNLHEDVKLFFEDARAHDCYHKNEERRIAHRYRGKEEWAGLKSIGAVENERRVAFSLGE